MKCLELLHYSNKPLTKVVSCQQKSGEIKPYGLWCSVGTEWEEWCRQQEFRIDDLKCVHEVTVRDDANLLYISGSIELDRFTEQYRLIDTKQLPLGYTSRYGLIDWSRVAADCGGIVIAPYCWERRLAWRTHWYYGWDCASACIWDAWQVAAVRARSWEEPPR